MMFTRVFWFLFGCYCGCEVRAFVHTGRKGFSWSGRSLQRYRYNTRPLRFGSESDNEAADRLFPEDNRLILALQNGYPVEVVEQVVDQSPETLETTTNSGGTALHTACKNGASVEVVKLLIEKIPMAAKTEDSTGNLPLHLACRGTVVLEVVRQLIMAHSDGVKEKTDSGETPLQITENNPVAQESAMHLLQFTEENFARYDLNSAVANWKEKEGKVEQTGPIIWDFAEKLKAFGGMNMLPVMDKGLVGGKRKKKKKAVEKVLTKRSVLVLLSNPRDQHAMRLVDEFKAIKEARKHSEKRDEFCVDLDVSVTSEDLRRALIEYSPEIVHFCGHGAGKDGLVFEKKDGKSQLVSGETLAGLLSHFPCVECVVLNACLSEAQAKPISAKIKHVIGTKNEIKDAAAVKFSCGFYDALFAGLGFDVAFAIGCSAIALDGITEEYDPIYFCEGKTHGIRG